MLQFPYFMFLAAKLQTSLSETQQAFGEIFSTQPALGDCSVNAVEGVTFFKLTSGQPIDRELMTQFDLWLGGSEMFVYTNCLEDQPQPRFVAGVLAHITSLELVSSTMLHFRLDTAVDFDTVDKGGAVAEFKNLGNGWYLFTHISIDRLADNFLEALKTAGKGFGVKSYCSFMN